MNGVIGGLFMTKIDISHELSNAIEVIENLLNEENGDKLLEEIRLYKKKESNNVAISITN